MSAGSARSSNLRTGRVQTVLCDADGNLFPSEEPAFEASTSVLNRLLASLGVRRRYDAEELRRAAAGRNFRAIAADLAAEGGADLPAEELERYVALEREEVTRHLGRVLKADPEVLDPVRELRRRFDLAVVSSSAMERLDACFAATALDEIFPREVRYSAEDSLAVPTSKPDPAIYRFALARCGSDAQSVIAIEDAVSGVRSAVDAGIRTIGNLQFVPPAERGERREELFAAGAAATVESWAELAARALR